TANMVAEAEQSPVTEPAGARILHSSMLVNPRSDFHDDVNRLRTNVSGIGASVKQRSIVDALRRPGRIAKRSAAVFD
ncbi:hypothetical protein, partial [Rhizobium rhizogenes]|uniref:hypothetical protein n=1 Tax=Rhizobium rhizogenes TaxID=359 RepID=UPI001961B6ED